MPRSSFLLLFFFLFVLSFLYSTFSQTFLCVDQFWSRSRDDRRLTFRALAKEVEPEFSRLEALQDLATMDFSAVVELLDLMFDVLHSVWKVTTSERLQYPKHRMQHFFDVVGSALCRQIISIIYSCFEVFYKIYILPSLIFLGNRLQCSLFVA